MLGTVDKKKKKMVVVVVVVVMRWLMVLDLSPKSFKLTKNSCAVVKDKKRRVWLDFLYLMCCMDLTCDTFFFLKIKCFA